MFDFELLRDAIVLGILIGCFYAAVSLGLTVAFGLLDVPHLAYPSFLVLGAYFTYLLYTFGIDPLVAGVMLMPLFFVLGMAMYRIYHVTFEKRGTDAGVRGLAFFFGVMFIIEVGIILAFGVDQRTVSASYIGNALRDRRDADPQPPDRGVPGGAGDFGRPLPLPVAHVHGARHPRRRPG